MQKEEIIRFINDRISSGGSLSEAREILLKQGVSQPDIDQAVQASFEREKKEVVETKIPEEKKQERSNEDVVASYNDGLIKKKIRNTKIFMVVSILGLVIFFNLMSFLRVLALEKTGNLGYMNITSLFYLETLGELLVLTILVICTIIILSNHRRLSTYNVKKFSIRASVYALIIIVVAVFFFLNAYNSYPVYKELDQFFVPTMQEIVELSWENIGYFNESFWDYQDVMGLMMKNDYSNTDIMLERLNKTRQSFILILNNSVKIKDDAELIIKNEPLKRIKISERIGLNSTEDFEKSIEFARLRLSILDDMEKAIKAKDAGNTEEHDALINELSQKIEKEKEYQT